MTDSDFLQNSLEGQYKGRYLELTVISHKPIYSKAKTEFLVTGLHQEVIKVVYDGSIEATKDSKIIVCHPIKSY